MTNKDSRGRQLIRMHELRDGLVTASASLSTGTAATLLAAETDYFLDMIEATFANNSNAAAQIALKNDATTIRTLQIPAGDTLALRFDAALKQLTKNTPWVVDMEDITGTTIEIGATFVRKND